MKRALRRHHYNRLKAKRKGYWHFGGEKTKKELGQLVSTPHPCSCLGCGNQRAHLGPTMQERRFWGIDYLFERWREKGWNG